MKTLFKFLLKHYLRIITKIVLVIHRPTIIAVAGSTNKNFVKQEVKKRLEEMNLSVRANPKNFNTEIGLPLAILYLPSGYNEYKKWFPTILKAPLKIFQGNFPEFLVLSLGTSDEGDMKYLLSIVKPNISIITEINQKYKEGFSDMDNLVKEYETLIKNTDRRGSLILNCDNYRIREIAKNKPQRKIFYGFDARSEARILAAEKNKKGQEIKISYKQEDSVHQIPKFGKHHAYAFIVGYIIKKDLKK